MNDRINSILDHMLKDVKEALQFAEQINSCQAFSKNPLYRKAIVMSIINIGELTKRLPDDFKSENSVIPWRQISGMRDISAHGYHIIDDEILWDVVKNSIPELLKFLQEYFTVSP